MKEKINAFLRVSLVILVAFSVVAASLIQSVAATQMINFDGVGDVNGDGEANLIDFVISKKRFAGLSVPNFINGDVNKDGSVDAYDLSDLCKFLLNVNMEIGPKADPDSIWSTLLDESEELLPPPAAGEYGFCENEAVDGKITLTGISAYINNRFGSINASGNEGTSQPRIRAERYIYVPAGTVIDRNLDAGLYTYDESFVYQPSLYSANDADFATSAKTIALKSGAYTVNYDCYIRYCFVNWAAKDENGNYVVNSSTSQAVIDEIADSAVVFHVPADRVDEVYITDIVTEETIALEAAYEQEKADLLTKYGNIISDGSLNYFFITDLHAGNNQAAAVERQLEQIVEIVNELKADGDKSNDIDFVALGGDLSTGNFGSKGALGMKEALQEMLKPLKKCTIPVLFARGNHDDGSHKFANYDSTWTDEEIAELEAETMSEAGWYHFMLSNYGTDDNTAENKVSSRVHDPRNPDSAYYYYDFDDKQTRVICLDSINYGEITPDTYAYKTHYYGADQLYWLINKALKAPDGWDYVFISHMDYQAKREHEAQSDKNFSVLDNILSAYQHRMAYKSRLTIDLYGTEIPVECDFSSLDNDSRILSYQFGHHHTDTRFYDEYLGIANMTIGTAGQYTSGSGGRVAGTITEALFDLVVADRGTVNELRFGYGNDLSFNLTDPNKAAIRSASAKAAYPTGYTVYDGLDYSKLITASGSIWAHASEGYLMNIAEDFRYASTSNYIYVPAGTKLYQHGSYFKIYLFDAEGKLNVDYMRNAGCTISSNYNCNWMGNKTLEIKDDCWMRYSVLDPYGRDLEQVGMESTRLDVLKMVEVLIPDASVGGENLPEIVDEIDAPVVYPDGYKLCDTVDYTKLTYTIDSIWLHAEGYRVPQNSKATVSTTNHIYLPAGTRLYSTGASTRVYLYGANEAGLTHGELLADDMVAAGCSLTTNNNCEWMTEVDLTVPNDCWMVYCVTDPNGRDLTADGMEDVIDGLLKNLEILVPEDSGETIDVPTVTGGTVHPSEMPYDFDYSSVAWAAGALYRNKWGVISIDGSNWGNKRRVSTEDYIFIPAGTKIYPESASYQYRIHFYNLENGAMVYDSAYTGSFFGLDDNDNPNWVKDGSPIVTTKDAYIRYTMYLNDTYDFSLAENASYAQELVSKLKFNFTQNVPDDKLPHVWSPS